MKYITVKLTEDQLATICSALEDRYYVITQTITLLDFNDLNRNGIELLKHQAYTRRLQNKLAKAKN